MKLSKFILNNLLPMAAQPWKSKNNDDLRTVGNRNDCAGTEFKNGLNDNGIQEHRIHLSEQF